MSVFYNTNIVSTRDSLVLLLDSTNVKSYPGSGTTWYDLSQTKNNATMYGSVPLTTDTVLCWDFSSVTTTTGYSNGASLGFQLAASVNSPINSYTFSAWVKNPPTSSGQVGLFSNAGGGDGFRYGIAQNGIYYLCGPTYTETGIGYITSYDNTKWHHIVTIFDRRGAYTGTPAMYMYLDGIYQGTGSLPSSQTEQSTAAPGIVRSPCCGVYTGKLALLAVYNIALTASQVLIDYNANKSRFGR